MHTCAQMSDTTSMDVRVTGLGSRVSSAVLPLVFGAMLGAILWRAATLPTDFIDGLPAGTPRWVQWLILILLAALTGYVCWRGYVLRELRVVGERLQIQGVFARADVPLSDVIDVEWINRTPGSVGTPEARLTLGTPCLFGTRIYFSPRSFAAFDAFRARVASVARAAAADQVER